MALHDFKCSICGRKEEDVFLKPDQVDEPRVCETCGGEMEQSFKSSLSVGHKPFVPYVDYHSFPQPTMIESHAHREKLMRQHNLRYSTDVGVPGCEV